jgi:serine/threonine protein kinase
MLADFCAGSCAALYRVKLGTHAQTGEQYALKFLRKEGGAAAASVFKQVRRRMAAVCVRVGTARVTIGVSYVLMCFWRRQVQREIEAMTRIDHEHVLKLYHVNWDAVYPSRSGKNVDVVMIVLELGSGGELFDFLSYTGCFEESIARSYFHQLVSGVMRCHESGIAHRDLKPEVRWVCLHVGDTTLL